MHLPRDWWLYSYRPYHVFFCMSQHHYRHPLPFTAHLKRGSDPDITVSPTSGELAPVNSRGTLFFITYEPKTYGRSHRARLVVQVWWVLLHVHVHVYRYYYVCMQHKYMYVHVHDSISRQNGGHSLILTIIIILYKFRSS